MSCLEDKNLTPNTANFSLNTLVLRFGETKLSKVKDICFIFAHDLLECAQNGGDMENLSAKDVYAFLTNKLSIIHQPTNQPREKFWITSLFYYLSQLLQPQTQHPQTLYGSNMLSLVAPNITTNIVKKKNGFINETIFCCKLLYQFD